MQAMAEHEEAVELGEAARDSRRVELPVSVQHNVPCRQCLL